MIGQFIDEKQDQGGSESLEEATTTANMEYSIPQINLDKSMNKYYRQSKKQLEISNLIEEISSTIARIIDKLLHQRIYSKLETIINEVLCIRAEVTAFSKQQTIRQEQINQETKKQFKKMKRRLQEMSNRSQSLKFQYFAQQSNLRYSNKNFELKSSDGIQSLIKDIYQFMQKNQASGLIRQCQDKIQNIEERIRQERYQRQDMQLKFERFRMAQKGNYDSLKREIMDMWSKETINKRIEGSLKESMRYIFDDLVYSRKDFDQLKISIKSLEDRQRQMEFNYTILEHKLS